MGCATEDQPKVSSSHRASSVFPMKFPSRSCGLRLSVHSLVLYVFYLALRGNIIALRIASYKFCAEDEKGDAGLPIEQTSEPFIRLWFATSWADASWHIFSLRAVDEFFRMTQYSILNTGETY
jgi:hypothetical protein